jgi:hypothetical protein
LKLVYLEGGGVDFVWFDGDPGSELPLPLFSTLFCFCSDLFYFFSPPILSALFLFLMYATLVHFGSSFSYTGIVGCQVGYF